MTSGGRRHACGRRRTARSLRRGCGNGVRTRHWVCLLFLVLIRKGRGRRGERLRGMSGMMHRASCVLDRTPYMLNCAPYNLLAHAGSLSLHRCLRVRSSTRRGGCMRLRSMSWRWGRRLLLASGTDCSRRSIEICLRSTIRSNRWRRAWGRRRRWRRWQAGSVRGTGQDVANRATPWACHGSTCGWRSRRAHRRLHGLTCELGTSTYNIANGPTTRCTIGDSVRWMRGYRRRSLLHVGRGGSVRRL
jgi:hypothetical protein